MRLDDATRNTIAACWAAADDKTSADDWPAAYAPDIDNIRAALTWAFALKGDASIGVALAAASAPVWLEMSLLTECHRWMGKAITSLWSVSTTLIQPGVGV